MKILQIVKSKLGISSNVRDTLLNHIIDSTKIELQEEHNLVAKEEDTDLVSSFLIDYVCFKYQNRDYKGVPRYLQFRLHNLKVNRLKKK